MKMRIFEKSIIKISIIISNSKPAAAGGIIVNEKYALNYKQYEFPRVLINLKEETK